ncbi:bifunctional diguanylate cyclase/phosphodiesterase [Actinoplanes sp. NPDC026619]|uniref:putative bifunctional diguanylate cyclase/phosphodiesterase n=1 Tax=Actinoplanes sp. NPDC026619 TaxID=3155798 RepID=UPI0033EA9A5C
MWLWWVAAGVAVIAGISLIPAGSVARDLAGNAVGLATVLAIFAAVRLHRPQRPAMWYWLAAGGAMSVLGNLVNEYYDLVRHIEPYPSLADAFYLAEYPMFLVGMLLLVRRRRRLGFDGLLDAAIVTTGLGLVFWIFVLHPTVADGSASLLERWISTAYPAADVLLLAVLARLFTDTAGGTPATRLLTLAALLLFAGDVALSVATLHGADHGALINLLFLPSYLSWGAAALHPSAADAAPVRESRRHHARVGLFAVCSMAAPALLFVPGIGADSSGRRAVAIGAMALFVLVLARLATIMKQARNQSAELSRLAMSDDLTGLPNRRRLEQGIGDARHPQVALLGLDAFKNVNDELGRPAADRVLIELAARLAEAAPPGALVARTGGDEFAVLLSDANADDLRAVAEDVLRTLRRPAGNLLIGVSAGLAGGAGVDPVELLREAETAMHAAKRTGEIRRWTPALDERSLEHARLGAELRTALDEGQFRVVYQPIVELPTERILAVEALVRWDHPVRGPVSPVEFIPVAEQNGLIIELGAWILRTACHRLASWRLCHGAAAPDRISVNVSAKQLARPGFAASVAAVLAETGLSTGSLTVEVTETAVFEGGAAVTALHELRALGVHIALDDFGTGHSSLGLLQTVPVTTIKVDKSFVDDITGEGRPRVIAEALIKLCDGLGLRAVAEGVETAEQAAVLSALGYRYLQGYYYGRPVAEPDFQGVAAVA